MVLQLHIGRLVTRRCKGMRGTNYLSTSSNQIHQESSRLYRIRTRKSLRGQLLRVFDNSIDWLVVTIVGFLTAISAFLIVRAEQWLFDLKEGKCASGWWHARRFCSDWREWSEIVGGKDPMQRFGNGLWAIEYVVYTIVAVRW